MASRKWQGLDTVNNVCLSVLSETILLEGVIKMAFIICYIVLGFVYFCASFINDAFISDERIYLYYSDAYILCFPLRKKEGKRPLTLYQE